MSTPWLRVGICISFIHWNQTAFRSWCLPMLGQWLVDVTVASTRIRLARRDAGFVITRTISHSTRDPVQIRRWHFPSLDRAAAGAKYLDEALAAAEAECCALRSAAEQATRRAIAASQRMRAGSGALRACESESAAAMNHYLDRGLSLATECAAVQARLSEAGFPTAERDFPSWMAEISRITAATADQPAAFSTR